MNETVRRKIIIEYAFTDSGEHEMNMLKAYTKQKVLSWGLSVCSLTEKVRR